MKAVGIDLAGVQSRSTGLCLMDGNFHASTYVLHTDDEIIRKTLESNPDVVAIDAPLALPRGRKSLAKPSNVHLRECDRELLKMRIKFFPLTLGPMRQLTERGIQIRADLEDNSLKVIETYPGAAQDILHIPRKKKGLGGLAGGLHSIGIEGFRSGASGDELDAVTCAFVGILYLQGKYRAIGDPDEILMILPP